MSALAITLVLISALFHALRSLFTKESGDKQIFLWLHSLFALLFFSPLFFIFFTGWVSPNRRLTPGVSGPAIFTSFTGYS